VRDFVQNTNAVAQSSKWVRGWSLVTASVFTLGLASCTGSAPTASHAPSPQAEGTAKTAGIKVVTTFLPITQFTKAVAGDRAQVTQLLPTRTEPHDFQAKPEDIQAIAKAQVLVKNGLGVETFLDDLLKNAENPNLKMVDTSQGIQAIATEAGERRDHNTTKKGDQGAETVQDRGAYNPHIWLDPKRAIQQVENIRDGLSTADPGGKDTYIANAAAYIEKLKILDRDIAVALKPYAGKTFVVFHDFAPYFAQSYHLNAQFLVNMPEENPSPDDVKRIVKAVKASNLKTLLSEPQAAENTFSALAGDLKVKVSAFDSLETGGAEAVNPTYYLTTMRKNLESLKAAFGTSNQVFYPLRLLPMIAITTQPFELLGGLLG
jgi:zinc transport system substrate-binding protein